MWEKVKEKKVCWHPGIDFHSELEAALEEPELGRVTSEAESLPLPSLATECNRAKILPQRFSNFKQCPWFSTTSLILWKFGQSLKNYHNRFRLLQFRSWSSSSRSFWISNSVRSYPISFRGRLICPRLRIIAVLCSQSQLSVEFESQFNKIEMSKTKRNLRRLQLFLDLRQKFLSPRFLSTELETNSKNMLWSGREAPEKVT